jgi:hypothetical protein
MPTFYPGGGGSIFSVIHDFVNLVRIKPPLAAMVQRPIF